RRRLRAHPGGGGTRVQPGPARQAARHRQAPAERRRPGMSDIFDDVVIGGGSSGSIVAAQLSEDPDRRVLLLEAGPAAEEHPETLAADGYKYAFINDEVI